ncbi:MAG: hypothetical protein JW791_00740 [Nanoarchaeota archaeon]|nr:hypothetical protein [Nanoarchaeota archaeon]
MISDLKKSFKNSFGVEPLLPKNIIIDKSSIYEVSKDLAGISFKIKPLSKGLMISINNKPCHELLRINRNRLKNYIVLNDKSSFLFTCNRKILKKGIVKKKGNGPEFAALNEKGEVLGVIIFKNKVYNNKVNIGYYLEQDKLKGLIF